MTQDREYAPRIEARFDPHEREAQLRAEAASWDTSSPRPAEPGEVPTIDIGPFLRGDANALGGCAEQLREASERVGFYLLTGHGLPGQLFAEAFAMARRFFALPPADKAELLMDRPGFPLKGVGYLPIGTRKLPRRERGNLNEAFLVKSGNGISAADNQWPPEALLPGLRGFLEGYGRALTELAGGLLPVYAAALDLDRDFFAPAFTDPFYRLRLTHYPPLPSSDADGEDFSIAPHVDSTFFTILAQGSPGLTIHHGPLDAWLEVPYVEGALVINTGELLKQWSNDRFVSVKHFVRNERHDSRYSIPFFLNADADWVMECLPSCQSPDNPPRYPPISYLQSQAIAQGE